MKIIADIVVKLKKQYNSNCPFSIANALNINVVTVMLPPSVNGFYTSILNRQFIYLNCELDDVQRQVVMAHELGHAILHPTTNSLFIEKHTFISKTKLEREANIFAALLLIDLDELNELEYVQDECYEYKEAVSIENISQHLQLPIKIVELAIIYKKAITNR